VTETLRTGGESADELATAMAELASLLVDEDDLPGMLERVAHLAVRSIPDCDSAGVTLLAGDEPLTAAATDQRTMTIDNAQYRIGSGPCLESYKTKSVQRVVVEEAFELYPEFATAAARAGIRSFLAAPLVVRNDGIGSLNLYSSAGHGFKGLDEAVVVLFAAQAAVAVANARLYQSAKTVSAQLEAAMASRSVIEQAKGVLMAQRALDPDAAFDVLRRASQMENRKLRDIAADVVHAASAGLPLPVPLH
jgi:GAF domain-containing protein